MSGLTLCSWLVLNVVLGVGVDTYVHFILISMFYNALYFVNRLARSHYFFFIVSSSYSCFSYIFSWFFYTFLLRDTFLHTFLLRLIYFLDIYTFFLSLIHFSWFFIHYSCVWYIFLGCVSFSLALVEYFLTFYLVCCMCTQPDIFRLPNHLCSFLTLTCINIFPSFKQFVIFLASFVL